MRPSVVLCLALALACPVPALAQHDHGAPVDEHLRVADGVWALGDNARVPIPGDKVAPPTSQFAIRQGKLLARNIAASLGVDLSRTRWLVITGVALVEPGRKAPRIFHGLSKVRMRAYSDADIEEMCRTLLANTVIENFRIERLEQA